MHLLLTVETWMFPLSWPGLPFFLEGHTLFLFLLFFIIVIKIRMGMPHFFVSVYSMLKFSSFSRLLLFSCTNSSFSLVIQMSLHLSWLPIYHKSNCLNTLFHASPTGFRVSDWCSLAFSPTLLHGWLFHTNTSLAHCVTQCPGFKLPN